MKPDFISKIQRTLVKLPPFKRVVVGCSGGVDSMVLSHVLKELGYEVILAHLNHNLRGEESEGDEQFVRKLGEQWQLPVVTKSIEFSKKGNVEAMAREQRYRFLEEVRQQHQAEFIAVGHHFDDQIETILMHRERGAGWRGECGMQLKNGKIIRPLLDVSREQIDAYAKGNHLDFREDSSNKDLSFKRNHLRHHIIPTLKKTPDFEASIQKSRQQALERLAKLEAEAKAWLAANYQKQAFPKAAFTPLESDLQAEILIQLLGPRDLYKKSIERLIKHIKKAETGKKVTVKGVTFWVEPESVRLQKKTSPLPPEQWIEGQMRWGDFILENHTGRRLKVRSCQPGDRFQPTGMQGHKKLQDFFVDEKIPVTQRPHIPIVVDEEDQIVCVGNLRFDEHFKALRELLTIFKK